MEDEATQVPKSAAVDAAKDEAADAPYCSGREHATDLDALDEARRRPEVPVRMLTYAWEQTDEQLKIYVPFDQSDELADGVDEDFVTTEFGEWSVLLQIQSPVQGRQAFGLRIGDFSQRVVPDRCKCTVRKNRITLTLRKQNSEHWFNIVQKTRK
eukprot:gnl/TRDRNA2_/TRDRNA2_150739_c0_seq1.p1 gnl/TRDRNA2_/TRDRNA2_150739_c0~~gnl/TRDRNA2_/TRDRNA2_150739_c0_seq1.p1  ORF type:complete len:155 (+),score=35.06 gnl/TRDRNA2_/TRDRNA2_150739_c0_seq1:64-528(+)